MLIVVDDDEKTSRKRGPGILSSVKGGNNCVSLPTWRLDIFQRSSWQLLPTSNKKPRHPQAIGYGRLGLT